MTHARRKAGWQELPLRRVAVCRDDLREPLNAEERSHRSGDVPYWGANTIQGYVDQAKFDRPAVLIGEDGAPFFDRDRPVAFYVDEPVWPNNHIHVLFARPGVDPQWLAWALNGADYSLAISGSTRDKLTQGDLLALRLLVPPLDEQVAIVRFLANETGKMDALIIKQERLIDLLAERKTAVISGALAERGNVRIQRLRYLYRPSGDSNRPSEQVLSVYRDHGVIPKASRSDNFNRTPEDVTRYLLVRPGDLVVNRMKAWQGSLGISSYRGIVSGDYEVLRPTTSHLLPRFAHYLLRSRQLVGEYRVRSTGIRPSQWRLYWEQMADIRVPVPPIEEQCGLVDYLDGEVSKVEALSAKAEAHIALVKERRAALIDATLTGNVTVSTGTS